MRAPECSAARRRSAFPVHILQQSHIFARCIIRHVFLCSGIDALMQAPDIISTLSGCGLQDALAADVAMVALRRCVLAWQDGDRERQGFHYLDGSTACLEERSLAGTVATIR